jgi:hypothetical protein
LYYSNVSFHGRLFERYGAVFHVDHIHKSFSPPEICSWHRIGIAYISMDPKEVRDQSNVPSALAPPSTELHRSNSLASLIRQVR